MPNFRSRASAADQLCLFGCLDGPSPIDLTAIGWCSSATAFAVGQEHHPDGKTAVGPVFVANEFRENDEDSETERRSAPGESSDNYPFIVVLLELRWRVIDSREPCPYRQWILQIRKSPRRWEGRSYCQSRRALESAVAWRVGRDRVALLAHLPLRIGRPS